MFQAHSPSSYFNTSTQWNLRFPSANNNPPSLQQKLWNSFPSIKMGSGINKIDANHQPFTVYEINVRDGSEEWIVYKRYKQFAQLHDQLKSIYEDEDVPELPSSINPLGPHRSNFDNDLRNKLGEYLHYILNNPTFLQAQQVRNFLSPSVISHSSATQSTSQLLLPAPPANVEVPSVIEIKMKKKPLHLTSSLDDALSVLSLEKLIDRAKGEKEEIYLVAILNSIKDNLEYLMELQIKLKDLTNVSDRVKEFESRTNRIEGIVSTLKSEKSLIIKLINSHEEAQDRNPSPSRIGNIDEVLARPFDIQNNDPLQDHQLMRYLHICIRSIDEALSFIMDLENSIYEELIKQWTLTNSKNDLESKISDFEKEAERIAFESVGNDPEEISKIIKRIRDLDEQVDQRARRIVEEEPQDDINVVYVKRMGDVRSYLANLLRLFREKANELD